MMDRISEFEAFQQSGYGEFPVCIAKTPYSFSADPGLRGAPDNFRLPVILALAALHALLSSVLGVLLALLLGLNTGAAVVLAGGALFVVAWLLGPVDGLLVQAWRRRRAGLAGPTRPRNPA